MFWADLKYIIFKCFNRSHQIGKFHDFLSGGIISLIPKGNEPRDKLANWRSLTLLNFMYKIYSRTIAARINIISADQCGFVQGRFIGE